MSRDPAATAEIVLDNVDHSHPAVADDRFRAPQTPAADRHFSMAIEQHFSMALDRPGRPLK
jgi:hypothetical protein